MAIWARRPETNWKPAPEGLHQAVCCDVWEPWEEQNTFTGGMVMKTRLVWQLEEENSETGRRFEVSQPYTLSLHEKATLCKHLTSWRGRAFTKEEAAAFDLEKLIGVNCQLQVVHAIRDKGTFANVQAIVPLGKGMTQIRVTPDYVRKKDRTQQHPPSDESNGFHAGDEDVPF